MVAFGGNGQLMGPMPFAQAHALDTEGVGVVLSRAQAQRATGRAVGQVKGLGVHGKWSLWLGVGSRWFGIGGLIWLVHARKPHRDPGSGPVPGGHRKGGGVGGFNADDGVVLGGDFQHDGQAQA